MARVVEDHGHVDALAGEAGARAARQNRSARGAAGGQRGLDIGGIAGKNNADGKLAVIGGVGSVEGARAEIEAEETEASPRRDFFRRLSSSRCAEKRSWSSGAGLERMENEEVLTLKW